MGTQDHSLIQSYILGCELESFDCSAQPPQECKESVNCPPPPPPPCSPEVECEPPLTTGQLPQCPPAPEPCAPQEISLVMGNLPGCGFSGACQNN